MCTILRAVIYTYYNRGGLNHYTNITPINMWAISPGYWQNNSKYPEHNTGTVSVNRVSRSSPLLGAWWRQQMEHFQRHWSFLRGIHRLPVDSPCKGQWRGVLMFSLIYARTNDWANNRDTRDVRRHHVHYDVTIMVTETSNECCQECHAAYVHNPSPLNYLLPVSRHYVFTTENNAISKNLAEI